MNRGLLMLKVTAFEAWSVFCVKSKARIETGLNTHWEEVMTASPSRHYRRHHKTAVRRRRALYTGTLIWRTRCGRRTSDTAGGRWKRRLKT